MTQAAVLVALEHRHDDVDAALGPAVGDDGAAHGRLEVDAEVALRGVAQVAAPLLGGEGRVLYVRGEDDVGRERRGSGQRARAVDGAAELEAADAGFC